MNKRLQVILDLLQQSESLTSEEKKAVADAVKESDKEITITEFKLEKTEKVKRTTAILLEETIAELEQKRKFVEAQNRELEIEAALERVRSSAMAMHNSNDISATTSIVFTELQKLGTRSIRCGVGLLSKDSHMAQVYAATTSSDGQFHTLMRTISMTEHSSLAQQYETWLKQENYQTVLKDEDLKSYYNLPFFHSSASYAPPEHYDQKEYGYYFPFPEGLFYVWTETPYSESELNILNRFKTIIALTFRRYLDLKRAEAQARESQIQLAMERVRARTMAMQRSEELVEAASLLFKQVQSFSVSSFTCGFNLWEPDDISVKSYMAKPDGTLEATYGVRLPHTEHPHFIQSYEARKRGEDFFVLEAGGNELKDTYRYMFSLPDFKRVFEVWKDSGFSVPAFQISHYVFFSQGYLLFITYEPVPEMWDIFKRFGIVFEQTYTRFLDLQKAEAQAREAKVEAALERVRSRTMAMQRSEELAEVASILFQQVKALGVPQWTCGFNIWEMGDMDYTFFPGNPDGHVLAPVRIPLTDHWFFSKMDESRKRGEEFYMYEKEGEKQEEHYRYMMTLPGLRELLQTRLDAGLQFPTFQIDHFANFSHGNLMFITYEPVPEMHNVFKRFARVFEQTYTRFLDLKKAEGQAREAKIETALERVRSVSLAMHKSDELQEVVNSVFDRFKELEIETDTATIYTVKEGTKDLDCWLQTADQTYSSGIVFPYFDQSILSRETLIRGEGFVSKTYTKNEKDEWFNLMFLHSDMRKIPETRKQFIMDAEAFTGSRAHMKYTSISIFRYSKKEFTVSEHEVLRRFAKVFEQAYIRFLDLKKAEAQTRVAQIEASLERVRARAMGMHHSNELSDVLSVLFDQFDVLGIRPVYTFLSLIDLDKNKFTYRQTGKGGQRVIAQQVIDLDKMEEWKDLFENMRAGKIDPINCLHYPKESLEKVWEVFDEIYSALPEGSKVYPEDFPNGVYTTQAYCKFGYLGFDHTRPASEEDKDILQRFANEFARLYQRFLDLQKAEAQAKEARIEAGLERVRSRAMAMQTSDELNALIGTVFSELTKLDLVLTRCVIMTYDQKTNDARWWMANSEAPELPMNFYVQYHEHPPNLAYFSAWRERKVKFIYPLEGTIKKEWDEFIFSETELRLLPDFVIAGMKAPDRVYLNASFYNSGNLTLASLEPLSDEHFDILIRFAKVFDLTYTRFNDLKQAEAQAQEAKIETALERVRSRTMAMQHSSELTEISFLLIKQVLGLGIKTWGCAFNIFDEDQPSSTEWFSNEQGYKSTYKIPREGVFLRYYEAAQRGASLHVEEFTGDACIEHYKYLSTLPGLEDEMKFYAEHGVPLPTSQFDNVTYFKYGYLLFVTYEAVPEAHDTFKRFAKVFEQTYTRFLDLKKAEAQARESQVEAALEKVRSRSLAMHKAEELGEVITVVFDKLKDLNFSVADGVALITFIEGSKDLNEWMANPGFSSATRFYLPYFEHPVLSNLWNAKNQGKEFLEGRYTAEENRSFLNHIFEYSDYRNTPQEIKDFCLAAGFYNNSIVFQKNTAIFINDYTGHSLSKHEIDILKRFSKVFEQTYTRFLDLQKAEAQTREAQIEASLERVRSKAMAMHKSEDLTAAVAVVFDELDKLDLGMSRCGIGILNKEKRSADVWTTSKSEGQNTVDVSGDESMDIHPLLQKAFDAWVRHEDFNYVLQGEDLADYYRALQHTNFRLPESEAMLMNAEMLHHHYYMASFQAGALYAFREHPFTDEAKNVMKRFANVFNHTYKRFQDIQKAEAQARESQIEAALERVRSKTMAMHNSQDVGDTVATLFDELTKLGVKTNRCGILVFGDSDVTEVWTAKSNPSGKANLIIGHLDVASHPMLTSARNTWKNKETSFSYEMVGDDLINYYQMISNQPGYAIQVNMDALPSKEIHTEFYFPEGAVFAFTSEQIPFDHTLIFKRLAGVFGQTYRRYLDLQKAEAQARESQIEAALERVRSRTMAMHRSEEISDIVGKIFKELTLLDVALNRVLIWIFNHEEKYIRWWSANPEAESNAESYRVDYVDHPVFLTYYEAWKKRSSLLLYALGGELKVSWEDYLFKNTELSRIPKAVQDGMRSEKKIFTTSAIGDYGLLMAGCFEPFSDEVNDIIQRFGRVFQQSYTRYLDVQKAEAQAREATIEAALEKVRGKAMAMHNSNDLSVTASMVFTELRKLGINPFRCGVSLQTKESRKNLLYYSIPSAEGDTLSLAGSALLTGHPVLSAIYDNWVRGEDYFPVLKGESLINYYQTLKQVGFDVPVSPSGHEQYGYYLAFSEGVFYGWSEKSYTEDELKILHRFKVVIDLTFRRYMELQKSEENAMEAIRQASLDRVRAEIASMRTTTDLDRITPLIWKELNILKIPFVRCGVFIMDDLHQLIHTFLSTPEGKAIAAFHLPYETPGNIGDLLNHWRTRQMYISHWDATAFSELGELLVQQGAIPSKEVYMNTVPVDGIHLHCLPFMQGMLYVGNTTQLQESDIHLIQSVADAFSTAYARYEDFNKLESAKAQIEKTLTDLKLTQNQLVQSEKMASLGELTAGIAHEIQNPLNFVNNFSEVSNELLEEMKEEIQKGNYDDVEAITNNIKQNLEKILHHGRRADGIVKGMLQHSRSSSGVKEPTDINALADEYLRLAYHGFRAKDKSFNAYTNTDLDKSIGKINVVPQDIGRVVLNLITNAFYAVTEKQKLTNTEYRPTVFLSTTRHDDCVLILVKDNGNGIPKHIREKIFQPFFTTKPTGQGTGLGLSLSYDIVKAHGGELKVDTKEGEGSEFVIQLPVS